MDYGNNINISWYTVKPGTDIPSSNLLNFIQDNKINIIKKHFDEQHIKMDWKVALYGNILSNSFICLPYYMVEEVKEFFNDYRNIVKRVNEAQQNATNACKTDLNTLILKTDMLSSHDSVMHKYSSLIPNSVSFTTDDNTRIILKINNQEIKEYTFFNILTYINNENMEVKWGDTTLVYGSLLTGTVKKSIMIPIPENKIFKIQEFFNEYNATIKRMNDTRESIVNLCKKQFLGLS